MKTKTHTHKITSFIVLWFAFILVACNLGTAPAAQPPTLAPQNTAEPVATLGYSGSGNQVVEVASDISAPVANIDVELFNLTEQVDVGRLRTHVETLESFTTRHVNSTQTRTDYGIGAASTYIYNQFLDIQTNSQGRFTAQSLPFDMQWAGLPTRQENIVGVLQGTMPGAGFIIVGAHYDSINTDFEDATGFAPGANDNGSGVAGLIEMARVMSQRQYRSSIIFVAFSAEEVGRLGSKAFVTWTQQQGIVDVAGMINIDSIGNSNNRSGEVNESLRIFSCEEESICRDGGLSRHMARSMEFLGFAHDATLDMVVERSADRDGRYGDHFSFSEVGFPAIRVINTLEEFGNGSTQDTADHVEYPFLREAVQSIMLMTIAIADGPPPPRNITLRVSPDGMPTLIWEDVPEAESYVIALRLAGSSRYDHQIDWADGTAMPYAPLTSGEYDGLAIGTRGANGLIGRLSTEYALGR